MKFKRDITFPLIFLGHNLHGAVTFPDASRGNSKYDKQDQQGKTAFNECNPNTTQQQEPVTRSPGGTQTKTGEDTRQSTDRLITKMINNLKLISDSKKTNK
jgi:hypothetical protein